MGEGWIAFRRENVSHAERLSSRYRKRGGTLSRERYASLQGALYDNDMLGPRGKALQLEIPDLLTEP